MSVAWLGRRKAEAPTGELAPRDQRVVWRIAALLLDYPTQQTLDMLNELHAVAMSLPAPAGPALVSFLAESRRSPPIELAGHYVETFDLRRRHCLHLSYYAYGDTRKRGMALLRFKHAYRAAGVTLGEDELPDHLAVVLEFAATVDPVVGRRLLVEYRPVVELLRLSLHEIGSPYRVVLDAVCATLPELNVADRRRVAELAAQGPPEEEVGLEPFGVDPMLPELEGRR
ncbi:MAG: nitrate reductase molybdenum cofactor assembly chaperone [Pseudonocardiales bacterium]|nr:nitrate reductase molybdenum cofactor assembly chaperone [Pseudonocardiales bacterium]MBV9729906.1 nitrate reductase molybdenum cofactor assembly chaperone [Pseudonocardiales bacterium]